PAPRVAPTLRGGRRAGARLADLVRLPVVAAVRVAAVAVLTAEDALEEPAHAAVALALLLVPAVALRHRLVPRAAAVLLAGDARREPGDEHLAHARRAVLGGELPGRRVDRLGDHAVGLHEARIAARRSHALHEARPDRQRAARAAEARRQVLVVAHPDDRRA